MRTEHGTDQCVRMGSELIAGTRNRRSLRSQHLPLHDPNQDPTGIREEQSGDGCQYYQYAAAQESAGISGDHELLETGGEYLHTG
jgi:hypothetical protein